MIWSSVLFVLMLLGMLSGVYDMPSLMYVSSPPPCLCCLSVRMVSKVFYVWCFVVFVQFGFLYCDDVYFVCVGKLF